MTRTDDSQPRVRAPTVPLVRINAGVVLRITGGDESEPRRHREVNSLTLGSFGCRLKASKF